MLHRLSKCLKWFSIISVITLLAFIASSVNIGTVQENGVSHKVLTIGTTAYAAGTADYTCDGVDDDVQFQLALNALPNGALVGGEIVVLAGNYVFSATVTRAIANVTITGVGRTSYFAHDGATALFTAGGNNWAFSNLRVDTTAAALVTAMGATTLWSWENVTTSSGYFAYRTDDATTGASWNIPTGRGATYVIAASDAPAGDKAQADVVVSGANDRSIIDTALGTYKTVLLTQGTFYGDGTTLTVEDDETLMFSPETIYEPTVNVNVITVQIGGKFYGNGGKVDIDNSSVVDTFTAAGILVSGAGGSTETDFRQKTVVDDVMVLGRVSDGVETDRGKGIWAYSIAGEILEYIEITNCKIRQFKYGLYVSNVNSGQVNCNLFDDLIITNSVYMVYVDRSLATTGQINNNIFRFQTEPLVGVSNCIVYNYQTSMNYFFFDAANTDATLTNASVIRTFGGSRNTFEYYCEPSKQYYSTDVYDTFKPLEKGYWVEQDTPAIFKDGYQISIPFRDRDGAVACDVTGRWAGSHDALLTNSPTWGSSASGAKYLTFNGTTQYATLVNPWITFTGNCGITLIVAPNFANTDGALHIFCEVYRAGEYVQIRKSAANALECQWVATGSGGHNVTATGTVAWSAGQILIIHINKNETNDKLDLYCNGVLVNSAAGATGTSSANSSGIWLAADHSHANYAGGDYYFFGVRGNCVNNITAIANLTRELGSVVGFTSKNSGLATILNGQNHIHVTHGLSTIPTRVMVTPAENPTNAVTYWWVDGISATEFVITVDAADVGASNLDFHWTAWVGDGN